MVLSATTATLSTHLLQDPATITSCLELHYLQRISDDLTRSVNPIHRHSASAMKLSLLSQGRDNNFNLIRAVAALGVLVTHGFALSIGTGDAEPFRESFGITLGTIAVDIFFITSGFLVTSSMLNRKRAMDFIWARVLRIFPALFAMLLITVFVLGPIFTTRSLTSYLMDHSTLTYLTKNSLLFTDIAYTLPGVFESNPYKRAVNGSLWTMPFEYICIPYY